MQFIVYALVYPIIWLISKLPFRALYLFSDLCYLLVYRIIGYRKKVVRTNIQLTFPDKSLSEIKAIEKKFYHHLCDMFLEMIKSLSISGEELKKRYQFTNVELLNQFDKNDQSSCLMMGHYASYEWIFALQFYLKYPGHAIYKPIANKHFDKLVHKIRGRWNAKLLPARQTIKTIKNQQEEGIVSMYGFAADQSPKANRAHFWTDFLGYDLPFATGAERMSKQFNLPIFFLGMTKVKRGHYIGTFQILSENPNETKEGVITAAFVKALEAQIFAKPEFYLWTHKRFKHLGKKEEIFKNLSSRPKTQTNS